MRPFAHPPQFWCRNRAFLLFRAALKLPCLLALLLLPLVAILAAPSSARAAEMLFLSTLETPPSNAQNININNAWAAFQAQAIAEGLTPVDGRGRLSGTTPLPITADTKLIVIVTGTSLINLGRMAELQDALENSPNMAIVVFSESCTDLTLNCSNSQQNLTGFMDAVNAIHPSSWPMVTRGPDNPGNYTARLNMSSLYASTFANAGLSTLVAGNYTPLVNVPLDYALYTQAALPSPPPAIVTTNVVGLFIPQAASNNGQGACLFLTADASEFTNSHPLQYAPIALAFTTAALDPNGACAQPAPGVPDLSPAFSGLTSLTVGTPASVTLTISNADQAASTDGQVDVTLPAGITLASTPAGCTTTATGFSCTLPGIAASGSTSFTFQISAPAAIHDVIITAEVSNVTNEINKGNNRTELMVSAPGYPDLVSAISGPASLNVGGAGSVYTVTVTNQGNLDSNDGTVNIFLPVDAALDTSTLPPHCTATATGLSCTLGPIAQKGGTATIKFTLKATRSFSNESIQVQVRNVDGEQVINNNDSTGIVSAAASSAQPIPALNETALALLALMMAGGAVAGLRRKGNAE